MNRLLSLIIALDNPEIFVNRKEFSNGMKEEIMMNLDDPASATLSEDPIFIQKYLVVALAKNNNQFGASSKYLRTLA